MTRTDGYQGILCLDKPADHTSHDAIARVRGILHMKKVGHGGTLDPMATGVLPVFLGRATRCCDILPVQDKRYTASAKMGCSTDTQDVTGRVTQTCTQRLTRGQLEAALDRLRDGYDQIPPMYSAIQVDGRRLYDIAREGREVERPARHVEFSRLELTGFDEEAQTFSLDVECSKGTYIRTLIHDAAVLAGGLAVLVSLRRTMAAGFTLDECVTIDELTRRAQEGEAESCILPVERAFRSLPRVYLAPSQTRLLCNGVKIDLSRVHTKAREGAVAVYDTAEGFVAAATIGRESGVLEGVKLFCPR